MAIIMKIDNNEPTIFNIDDILKIEIKTKDGIYIINPIDIINNNDNSHLKIKEYIKSTSKNNDKK